MISKLWSKLVASIYLKYLNGLKLTCSKFFLCKKAIRLQNDKNCKGLLAQPQSSSFQTRVAA